MNIIRSPLALAILAIVLTSCDRDSENAAEQANTDAPDTASIANSSAQVLENSNESSIVQASNSQSGGELPYPVYPNGKRYRIGGENGLKVVLFQTEDTFEEVDAYYQEEADDMPRLSAMSDYVRYSVDGNDDDPWATDQPGIVIHQFNDESERRAVGADDNALTNIIMSY